jgi:hypothetical protein
VLVEMRDSTWESFINDGDWVEVSSKAREGELVRTKQVRNLTPEQQ